MLEKNGIAGVRVGGQREKEMGKRGSTVWWQTEIAPGGEHTVMYNEAEICYPHET